MKHIIITSKLHPLLCTTGAVALAVLGAPVLAAQQRPLLSAATRTPVARIVNAGFLTEGVAAPEPPAGQNNTAPLKDDLFAGTEKFAKNATEANEVDMDPDSLNLVNGPNAARAHRTLLNTVHHYEYDKPGMYNMADVEEFRRKLEGPDWHCSVHSRDLKSGESTDICSRRRAPDMIEKAIITVEPKELTFIHQIHRVNGEGGSLDIETPGMSLLQGLPPQAASALMQAEILASMAALQAELSALQGQLPSLSANLQPFHFRGPNLDPNFLKDFKVQQQLTPQQQKAVDDALRRLHSDR